jgi:hypothetical protein
MIGGFLLGVLGGVLAIIGMLFAFAWAVSGFTGPGLVLAIILFAVGAFLSYVSRQTVRTTRR